MPASFCYPWVIVKVARSCPRSGEEAKAMVGVGGEERSQAHLPDTCRDRADLRLLLRGPELMER